MFLSGVHARSCNSFRSVLTASHIRSVFSPMTHTNLFRLEKRVFYVGELNEPPKFIRDPCLRGDMDCWGKTITVATVRGLPETIAVTYGC